MTTLQQMVESQLKVIDSATKPMTTIEQQAGKTTGALEKAAKAGSSFSETLFTGLREVAGIAGVVGGALAFKSAIDSTEHYLKNIKEVHELTGATVQQTDFLFSSARKAGVEYEQMNSIMFSLSRRGSMLEQTLAASNGKTLPGMAKKMAHMGIVLDKGPVAALQSMSEALKKGKLDTSDLMTQLRIPPKAVNDFKGFLEELGGGEQKKMLEAITKGAKFSGFLQESDLDRFNQMENAQHRMHDAWNRIKVLVLSKFLPVVVTMAENFADRIESIIPKADAFGRRLAAHMDEIVFAAKAFVSVMTTKKLLDMLEDLSSAKGMLGKLANSKGFGFSGLAGGGGGLGAMASQVGTIVTTIARAVPQLALLALAVTALYKGYVSITESTGRVREHFMLMIDKIKARWEGLVATLSSVWEAVAGIFGQGGTFGQFLEQVGRISFIGLIKGIDFLLHVLRTAAGYLGEVVDMIGPDVRTAIDTVKTLMASVVELIGRGLNKVWSDAVYWYNKAAGLFGFDQKKMEPFKFDFGWLQGSADLWEKHWKKTEMEDKARAARITGDRLERERKATARETPDSRPPTNQFDFRGSRFDITQNFAEGFDPDRIAVAFSNDLAALGETRTQSGFAPALAAR